MFWPIFISKATLFLTTIIAPLASRLLPVATDQLSLNAVCLIYMVQFDV